MKRQPEVTSEAKSSELIEAQHQERDEPLKRWTMKRAPSVPRPPLSRRLFLRGATATGVIGLALPMLDGMLNTHGEAFAQNGDPIPTRFGVWFWGNGVRPEYWLPQGQGRGAAWSLSEELAPLQAHKSSISVLSGYTIHTGTHPHHAGMTGVMTGRSLYKVGDVRDTIISTFAGPSADVIAANYYAGQTSFRSLEVGVTRFRGTDEGTTFQHLSHNGPNNPNPSEYEPRAVFNRLFSGDIQGAQVDSRRSVLDAVMAQANRLRPRLGARDRQRIDQHLASLRNLEQRLASGPTACDIPNEPGGYPDIQGQEQLVEKNRVMSELVAIALACDLTRVFSVLYSTCGSGVIIHPAGATNGLHLTTHDEPMSGTPATQPIVHAATTFTMSQLAYFLDQLSAIPMGAGSLLDHSSVLCTSEHTDGRIHSYEDFPMIIAGLGGGRLVGDVHDRASGRPSITRGVLTALRGGGVELESFGEDAGFTRESIGALEA